MLIAFEITIAFWFLNHAKFSFLSFFLSFFYKRKHFDCQSNFATFIFTQFYIFGYNLCHCNQQLSYVFYMFLLFRYNFYFTFVYIKCWWLYVTTSIYVFVSHVHKSSSHLFNLLVLKCWCTPSWCFIPLYSTWVLELKLNSKR
jgi:hypothetical protein